jgi:hypothetical protein
MLANIFSERDILDAMMCVAVFRQLLFALGAQEIWVKTTQSMKDMFTVYLSTSGL